MPQYNLYYLSAKITNGEYFLDRHDFESPRCSTWNLVRNIFASHPSKIKLHLTLTTPNQINENAINEIDAIENVCCHLRGITCKKSSDNNSILCNVLGEHFLLTARQEPFDTDNDILEIHPHAFPYMNVQITFGVQGLHISLPGLNDDNTSKVILCYMLALARSAKFSDFFKEIQDAIDGTEIAYKKIERIHNGIHELDFKYFAITQSDQAIGELWNQLALSGVLDTSDRLKERILTLTERLDPLRRNEHEMLAFSISASSLLIALLSWMTDKINLLEGNNILILLFALAYLPWFAWVILFPPSSKRKLISQFLLCPGLVTWIILMSLTR